MSKQQVGRAWFASTAVVVLVGLVVQVVVSARFTGGQFDSVGARIGNVFCFFTIQSNVLVGVTSLLLAIRVERPSTLFRALRLAGLVGIAVTGVVFHLVLAGLHQLTGAAAFADLLLHTVSPVLCVLGWLVFGPRPTIAPSTVAWSALFPLLWLVFTLIRGAAIDYYPYPFVDVTRLGYGTVALNCVFVGVLFLGLAFAAMGLERRLSRARSRAEVAQDTGADRRESVE
ncbi:F420-dependent oxidoreductase [Solihabitans fulvus]|uniref:F420-dependent oxidoreductase n=1 Tax=Solihabitans fulvus TaxID=1892852 RepID=A0A5B2X0E5_9PSEU|nr:Pr6Pr family membrane protein [Solihabitans fulvus]KAA2256319.1 F420-dependent oxidoreductase [Solihabitans fulvus]